MLVILGFALYTLHFHYFGLKEIYNSILKPPKPRQPLQNLNFNTSSNESSPTCTIKPKRRVSFAEKKHVKEFCNSVEQGTVWDSTYEEHDLSNLKVPCTSNEEHCNVESVSTGNIEVANCCNEFIHISSETLDECLNFDKTVIYDNIGMEVTTVIPTVLKAHSDILITESDKTRIFHDNSMTTTAVVSSLNEIDTLPKVHTGQFESESDRTRVFQNNSMTTTAVVSSWNKMNMVQKIQSGRPTIFSNISMEMGETIPPLQNTSQMEISTMDTTGIKRAVLSESFKNRTCSTASSRDINVLAVPSPCSSESSDEENRVINNIENVKDDFTEKPIPNDIPDPINIEASMVLHDPLEQHTCASALNENNTEAASAPLNFAPSDSLCTITSDMNHGKCLQAQHSQDVVSHSRRTYTIKSLETDFSFTNSNKERSIIAETNNDIQDKDSCNDQFLIESNGVFFDKNVEELESIKPPSFICLDDLSNEDMPVNTNYDPEINKEAEVNSILDSVKRSEVPEYKKTPVLSKKNVLEEDVDKSRKCLNEGASLDNKLVASRFEFNDPTQFSEIQQLQLPQMDDTDTEVQALECFSLPIDDCKRIPVSDIINDPQHMNVQSISNPKNENMEHSALNANNVYEEISKPNIEDNHVCNDEVKSLSDQPQFFPLEQDVLIELDPFASLMKELRIRAQSDEIIWEVYHENIERKMFIIGFISCSLLIVVYLRDDCDLISDQYVKDIQIISRLTDDADVLISIVHRVILEKLSIKRLMDFYKNSETIPSMLDCVSKEVKLAMDFMFDLKRLESLNMMEISKDSVSFVSCTKKMDIVLRITVNIKPFENIESQDVSVHCLLGSVREEEIKKLITNIKKDHKFLRRFISDVRDYIYLMEESATMLRRRSLSKTNDTCGGLESMKLPVVRGELAKLLEHGEEKCID
ncbi:hypothetical protein WN55_03595 [Dufourea novaeangliae]|uniref:Uncharacterized protein n=1 Tax=Dufourea novaeangliae TaxID=178035 RepID=A0A154PIT1_DUFNO|nr:hypothetical protein WN55_03595 [Dufourea novaeangliae]